MAKHKSGVRAVALKHKGLSSLDDGYLDEVGTITLEEYRRRGDVETVHAVQRVKVQHGAI